MSEMEILHLQSLDHGVVIQAGSVGNCCYDGAGIANDMAWMGPTGRCSICGHVFVPSPELRRQSEAEERQLREDFEKHTCNDDIGEPTEQ
jgi:hypothetical protein